MKLIYCTECHDAIKLNYEMRFCMCGRVYGRYKNNVEAEVSKTAVSIAIGNGSLARAIEEMQECQRATSDEGKRGDYMRLGNGKIDYAWVRPNTGAGNPHTGICAMDIRSVAYCDVSLITPTNTRLNQETVVRIVTEGWNQEKGQAFPAWLDPETGRWLITDGNHRLEALKRMGEKFAPIVELSKEEYDTIAFQKKKQLNLMVHIPEKPKMYTGTGQSH